MCLAHIIHDLITVILGGENRPLRRYELDGTGIESRWRLDFFRICPDLTWWPPSFPYNGHRVIPGGIEAGACRWRPTPSGTEVKNMRRGQLKCDGTSAGTIVRISAKRTSPFKSAGTSVQSTTGSRGVRISGSNDGYTMFRGSVKGTWLPTQFASFPFTSPPVRHRVPSHFNWTQ